MLLPALITKPNYAASVVDRPRLYSQLDYWQEVRAVVVHAPAGYGKSSLVSRWLDVSGNAPRAAWLSLGESDSDPRQLVRGITWALDAILPGLLTAMQPVLDDLESEPQRAMSKLIATLWDGLVVDGTAPQAPWLLILDDLHLISSSDAIPLLAPFLDKGPPNLHVMLLTRDAPSLPLSRLYVGGQVIELTVADLRFTADEVRQYLISHHISCSPHELAQIMQRTEGWVAALQLAVNSQRRDGSLAEYLAALRGDSRWLAQYLTQEVLAQQSPAIRSFLLRTSILDSFSAPLGEAVSGLDDAYRLLAELQHNELFLVQLDAEGTWFRYHYLFQELLQQLMLEVEGKAAVDALHRRAADWLAREERLLPAIRHLQAAGDEDQAAALVESGIRPFILHHPTHAQLLFDALSPEATVRRPRLLLERCLASLMIRGKDLALHVHNAQRALAEHPPPQPQRKALQAELLVYRAATHFLEGELESATLLAQDAQSQSHELDRLMVGTLEFLWMHLSASAPDDTIPRRHAWRALAAFRTLNFATGLMAVRRELAVIHMRAGHSAEAGRELDRIIATFGNNPAMLRLDLAWVYIYAAEHCYWQDQLDRALHHVEAAMEIASIFQDDELARGLSYLQRLYALKARRPAAIAEQSAAVAMRPTWYHFFDWQIRWLLAFDRIDAAWEVAQEYQANQADDLGSLSYRLAIPYLRALIARGTGLEEAQPLLRHALQGSITARDYPRQLGLLALKAWQELQAGQESAARSTLAQAEALVAKTGYVRVLLDIPPLAALAAGQVRDDKTVAASQAAVDHLLTPQEQAVLTLLAGDRTYAQIAEELVISVNTVRTHVRHIYKKLAVHSRDQAIRRAQHLHLISPVPRS